MMMHQQHQQQGGGVPLGMPALGPYDPNYHYWYNNYSWWFFSGADHGTIYHAAVDAKLTRVAYGLAGQLVLDRIKKVKKKGETMRVCLQLPKNTVGGEGALSQHENESV